jgi:hypothetical protein
MTIEIESDIPLPELYPFAKMKVGDSFLIPPEKSKGSATVSAYRYGASSGKKFTIRKTDKGYRCWRIE